jgi:hypothetical protein
MSSNLVLQSMLHSHVESLLLFVIASSCILQNEGLMNEHRFIHKTQM